MKLNTEIKAINNNGVVTFEGWANPSTIDDVGDLMKFDKVDMRRYDKNPILFYNHDRNLPVGRVTEKKITPQGLWVKGEMSKSSDALISCVRDLVAEGILKTFSIGFDPIKEVEKNGVNEITEWRLNEISIVTLPCNVDAEFALTKQLSNKSYEEIKAMVTKAVTDGNKPEDEPAGENPPTDKPVDNPPPPAEPDEDEIKKKKGVMEDCISEKIPKLISEGKPQAQAVAIAMSMCSAEGKCSVELMTPEFFAKAEEIAKACAPSTDPKKPDEKAAPENITVPVSQPSNDPTNFGNPFMEVAKTGIALLGMISEQLKAVNATLIAQGKIENENENNTTTPPPATQPPTQQPGQNEEEQKAHAAILAIQKRISNTVKELNL